MEEVVNMSEEESMVAICPDLESAQKLIEEAENPPKRIRVGYNWYELIDGAYRPSVSDI